MQQTKTEILDKLNAHALKNYEVGGWDIWFEAFDVSEKLEAIGDATTFEEALKAAEERLQIIDAYRAEIQATSF